ncbi:uncharacterized protein LOC107804119 [Nicotiana tabacum]|uniref:Uncharacterized protein LOC107804119 n=2 Tax=Nicotiana TaxID=4085 RepID=A0A1S4B3K8_TOBAC|nr:PREDICTED: uncharacterized protein LOC104229526 [Nicotiana sylvestris]XP_016483434.1 PREDICTED: uncharacterized protein LOC107804119 [Nicotiana tabacum]
MGGEVSKVNASPTRIPPKFLYRLDDIRKKRRINRRTSKQSTPSKKELLSDQVIDEYEKESLKKEESVYKDMKKVEAEKERVAKLIEAIVEEEEEGDLGNVEDEDDDNYKDDERVVKRHVEEDNCIGSPSFRVYFTNNNVENKKNEVNIGKKDVFEDTTPIAATTPTVPMAATIPLTKEPVVKEGPKKERKRKSFRRALPKNLLNVRSCCSAAHSSPDRAHLLPGKAPA